MFHLHKSILAIAFLCVMKRKMFHEAADFTTMSFISDFLKFQKQVTSPLFVSAFVCWSPGSTHQLMRHLSQNGAFLSVHSTSEHVLSYFHENEGDGRTIFILDMDCQGSFAILQEANDLKMLRGRNKWIILQNSSSKSCCFDYTSSSQLLENSLPLEFKNNTEMGGIDTDNNLTFIENSINSYSINPDEENVPTTQQRQKKTTSHHAQWNSQILFSEDNNNNKLYNILKNSDILLDSDVTIARRFSDGLFLLTEVYKIRDSEEPIKQVVGKWKEETGVIATNSLILAKRRINLHQTILKTAMVVTNNDTFNHLDDNVDTHIDSISKVNYVHFKHILKVLNASVDMKTAYTWGYITNGSWSGMVGYMQNKEVDIGCTGMFVFKQRLPAVDFIACTTKTKSAFLFRPPPLSFVMNIFTLPFSRAVWLVSAAMIALISAMLHGSLRWEVRATDVNQDMGTGDHGDKVKATWADVILLSLGAVCQQGSPLEAHGVPGRTISIVLFVTVIFLYTSYSACIVALLQSTTDSIRSLDDLYHSGVELGLLDIVYARHLFSVASDPLRRSIYTKKINPSGGPHNFFSLEDGIAKVRDGLFAFHHELGPGYKIISDTFLEEEKCGLQTVRYSTDFVDPYIGVSKDTPFKEIFAIAYRILHESGLQERENLRFYPKKPECGGMGSSFVSVGIVDCYPAFLVLVYGTTCALFALLVEILMQKWCIQFKSLTESGGRLFRCRLQDSQEN